MAFELTMRRDNLYIKKMNTLVLFPEKNVVSYLVVRKMERGQAVADCKRLKIIDIYLILA